VKKSIVREYAESLIIAVILALYVRTWVFQAFKIPTGSMEPNLLVGDHLIVNRMVFAPAVTGFERALLPGRAIRRGDVVVFKFPKDPERDFIKRVIGLPGDELALKQKKIHINGKPIDEPYAHYLEPPSPDGQPKGDSRLEQYGPVTVPAGQYFMMGDNRDNSEDSRYWGFMPANYVKGEALFIYFSAAEQSTGWLPSVQWDRLFKRVR
jgi:signal peptidase I